jgi:hypothetical protein
MTPQLDHVIVTRFNLPSRGHESLIRARHNWLEDRIRLFERHCLPSVAGQTCRSYSWIIYFDPQSPRWLQEWIGRHAAQGHFQPIFKEEVHRADLLDDVRGVLGRPHGSRLLTTNLDNDDCLARDFVARLQEAAVAVPDRAAVYLADGLIKRGDMVFRRLDRHNAFHSVSEPWTDPVTCWVDWHNMLGEHMPVVVVRGAPAWLQVVHGSNVSNRVRGRRIDPAEYRDAFPGQLEDLPVPTTTDLAKDALVALPARTIREVGRAAAKASLSRFGGKETLDRVKTLWTATSRW